MSHTQTPDQAVREISITTALTAPGKPVLIAVDFQFLVHSSSTKKCEIINVKWFMIRCFLQRTALNFHFHRAITVA